ncbi:tandem-95 repeat protein [Halobacteriovorax sp. ZH5_bin.2]|uniref:tandem-95 repeat protein n=1 Tax=unclassified Halobacteriovorax TaxID=2639665 RepID=UPI003724312B
MKKPILYVGLALASLFSFSYIFFADNNAMKTDSYSELAKEIGIEYELVKPKVKARLNSTSPFTKRDPSSVEQSEQEESVAPSKKVADYKLSKNAINEKKKVSTQVFLNDSGDSRPFYANNSFERTPAKTEDKKLEGEEKEKSIVYSLPTPPKDDEEEGDDETKNGQQNNGSNNVVIEIPAIEGRIPPLSGLITQTNNKSLFISNAYAATTCTDPKVELFDLVTMTVLEDNPITFEGINTSTYFKFDAKKLALDLTAPARYKVKVSGCSDELEKVVTSYFKPQDITPVTTLLAKITNTDIEYTPTRELANYLDQTESLIQANIDNQTIDYDLIYTELENNTDAGLIFSEITQGETASILKDAAPKMKTLETPTSLKEGIQSDFEANAVHWDSSYQVAYQWILDGTTVSNASTWTYTPPADTAASANIIVRIGKKNDGDVNVNTDLPHHQFTYTLDIEQINDAPTLTASQSVNVTEDTVHNFFLTPGDDVDSPSLSYITTSLPANGTLTCVGTTNDCTYTPNADFVGVDTFTYKVNDGELDSTEATVSLNVSNVNDRPVIGADQSLTIAEDNTLAITLNQATDVDNAQATLTYKIVSSTSNGTLSNCITTGAYGNDLTCDYTPNANFYGSDSFSYIANDGSLDSAGVATVSLTITPVNDAPTLAATQAESTNEDTALSFNLNTGSDIEGTTLNYTILTTTSDGVLSCSQGTSTACTYAPNLDFFGTDSFTYKVDDGELDSTTATVTITVNTVNDAPVMGADQSEATDEDTALNFTLNTATDVDLPAQTISYKLVSGPTNGTLTNCITTGPYINDRDCTYTPNANYNGSDSFTYIANDTVTDAGTFATVTLTINAVNDAPTLALTQTVNTTEDTALNFTLNAGADTEGDSLSYLIVTNPTKGTLTCAGGTSRNCTYTPDLNDNGTTSFTYKVNDGQLDSTTATVTVNITSENDAPVMGADQTESTNEDTTLNFTLNAATDVDLPAQTISYKLISGPTNGSLSNCITTASYINDRDCTYTPNSNFNGTDSFTYIANDTITDALTFATVNLTINSVNDAPTLALTQTVSTNEDNPLNFTLNAGSDIEGDSLSYLIVSGPSKGTLACTGGTSRDCTYTPDLNDNGSTSFTYKVNDGQLDSPTASVTVNITSENDAPVMAGNQAETIAEDNTLSFTLSGATDVDIPAQTIQYKIITPPANGTLTNCINSTTYSTDITCDYTPGANFNGSDSFTYRANDTLTDSSTDSTVSITITSVNDAPTLAATQSLTTNEDTVLNFNLTAGSDIEGDSLSYLIVSNPANGTLSCTGGTSTACTFTPNLNYNGSTAFTYKVNDGQLDSSVATVTISVTSENDAPVMVADQNLTTNEDTVLSITLNGATDVDIPAQTIEYKLITAPTNGTLSNCINTSTYSSDITCNYTPGANFNGNDSFTYRANDTLTDSATDSTVSITITSVNDAPTLAATQSVSTNEDTALNFNLTAGSDIEADSLSYIIVSTPANGILSCTGGTSTACTFTPDLNFNGSTTFTYKVNDGALDSNTATVTITVNAVNDVPIMAADQAHSTNEDTALNFTLNGATDVDLPAQTLSYKVISAPSNGTLSNCITTGSYGTDISCTYTPNTNFYGSDSFTYTATDSVGVAVTNATVSLTVNSVNDAPTIAGDWSFSTNEDTAHSFNLTPATDIENDTLSYIVVSNPTNGNLSCTGGTSTACTYTPNSNFEGSDSFTYKANDGALDSNTVTVSITVNAINDAPEMVADQNEVTNEDTPLNITLNGATDVDVPAQTISYKVVSLPTNGTLSNCITTGSYGTDITCTYTPNANFNGTDSFTYLANDGLLDSAAISTVHITINAVNDAPTLAATQTVSTNEDTPLNFSLNAGADIDGDTLYYVKLTDPATGTLSCSGGTSRSCTYTPVANYNGTTSFTYRVNDGVADSSVATVTIIVNSINDAPVMAANQSYSTDDNTALAITLSNASDVDGDALTYKIVTAPSNGTLSNCITTGSYGTDLTCTYTSNVNFHGTETFTFIANDGTVDAASVETVTITVTDKTPSPPPSIALTSAIYTTSTANTMTISSCSDIASIIINEGTQPAAGDAWVACSTGANATTYTLASTTQGLHTLKAWSKDPHGNISTTSSNISVYYDTINPSLSLTTPTIQKGGNNINLAWNATDASTSSAQNFQVDFYNGSSWSSVGTTAAINGPISTQAFTRAWTVPSINTTNAKFRVSFTDLAGNSATVESSAFEIDSIAPALSYTSPANNSYHLSSTTINGNCESGLNINISGDIQAGFSIACSGGTFSQTVNFSDNDGSKVVTINQVDAAGNSTSASRTFIRDEVAPILTKTAGISPDFTNANTPNTWSGTCEGAYTIYVTGDETTSFNCSSGTWSWTPSPKTTDGTFVYNLVQTDAAGNTSSPALSLSWQRDATPPAFNATAPIQIEIGENQSETLLRDNFTISGTCEGTNVITISGTETDTITCSASSWTWTSANYTTDATRAFTFTQADSAGNTSALTYTWTRDSNFPALAIDLGSIKNNGATATFTGTCEDGLTINITGPQTTTTTCSSGTWSWTTATTASDVNNTYNFSQTNGASNTTTVLGYWYRETGLPVVNSITAGVTDPSPTNFVPYSLTASSQNANVYLTHICLQSNNTVQPAIDDACWIAVNSTSIGITPAQNITVTDYSYLLGWEPALYDVYAWVKDEAGNISSNTQALSTDYDQITYDKASPPTIWDVAAANNDTSSIPPTRADSAVPTGTDLYIRWKVDDSIGLPATAINIYYTQDEQTFTAIAGAQGIAPHTNHGCPGISLAANEGCFKWTGGSPLATAYKVRVKVTNLAGISTQLTSTPINADRIKIIAGNTEAGLGGDARSALFFNKRVGDSSDIHTLVFTDDGNIYFADYKRGIITVDPADGKQKLFIAKTGTSTGDGGPAESATLRYPMKITLDYQGRLLILDYNRIRRVDLNLENPTIETIIGGGSSTADTVANPLDLQMRSLSSSDYRTNAVLFTPLPNGDLWFNAERSESINTDGSFKVRIYKAATGQVESFYLGGTGDGWQSTQDLSKCRVGYTGIKFNQATSQIEGITGTAYHHKNFPGCDMYGSTSDYTYARVYFDPTTGQAITPFDNSYRWYHYYNYTGMDGKSYVTVARSYMNRNNFDGTYTRILGSGTLGECADGTLATACNMDIYSVFVDKNGKVYFNDRGRIRTLDEEGKVVTIFGQSQSYGDNVNAVNARFSNISRVTRLDNGKVVVNDTSSYYLKEFTIEGNINILAGNGTVATASTSAAANTQPVRNPYWTVVDRATGNIYMDRVEWHYGRFAMLNRSTGMWEDVFSNTSGTSYYDPTADGKIGSDIDVAGSNNRALPVGFANGKLFLSRMKHNSTDLRYEDFMLKAYDSADSYRQEHIWGVLGYNDVNEGCTELRTAPTSGSTCEYEYWDNYRNIFYDSVDAKYVTAKMYRGAQRRVIAIKDGNVEQIAYTARNIDDGFVYTRRGGTQYLYYCYGSRLYGHNIDTDTDLGALSWTMPQLSCRGVQFDYNPTNDSIIFPFEQNGLYGVAEYFL